LSLCSGPPVYVRLGGLDLDSTISSALHQDIAVFEEYVHPNWNYTALYNDIALLELRENVVFGSSVHPACLETKRDIPVDTLQAIGWGALDADGTTTSHLMKVDLKILKQGECQNGLAEGSLRLIRGILDDYQICAGDPSGKDTCQVRNTSMSQLWGKLDRGVLGGFGRTASLSGRK
jgi:hypothetical protein